MRKIMFIINQLGGGGAERVLTILANHLVLQDQYEVSIFAINKSEDKYNISKSVTVTELGNQSTKFKLILKIREHIRMINPEVIISFEYHMNMKVLLATWGMNVDIIVSERNDPARKGGKFLYKQLRNILYKKAKCLVCQTPDAKAYFPQRIQTKTVVIPNPITSELPEPWSGDRNKEIVNFCRLEPQKNLKLLLDSFAEFVKEFPDYTLSIFGNGMLKEELEYHIRLCCLEDTVSIYSAIPNIHDRVKKASMFISSSDYEGLSNSMLEAMALGIPTICTDCPSGGSRMVIQSGDNGLLVPVGQVEPMVKAMKKVATNNVFAKKISNEALKIREQLSSDKIIKQWIEVIDCINRRKD